MAKLSIQAGSTGISVSVFLQASTSTTGLGMTGLAGTSAGLTAYYYRPDDHTTAVPITLATSSLAAAWTSALFVEVNATSMNGWYRFDMPNAVLGTGAKSAAVHFQGAANMAPLPLEIELTGWNNQIAVQTSVLAPQVHTGAIIPLIQTASNLTGTVVLAPQVHTAAIIPIVQTASNLGGTVVLAPQVHTSAVIPIVQTASNLGGTVVLAPQVHTSAVIPIVQTASSLGGTVVLAPQVHTSAIIPIVQTASNVVNGVTGTATVILAAGIHTGAIIPVVQTASVALVVGTALGIPPVTLATGTHVGAVIPTVNITQTSADKTNYTLTVAQHLLIASAVGTAIQAEAYPGTGTAGASLAQMGYAKMQDLQESNIVYAGTGTVATKNVLRLNQSSTAMTFNLAISTSTEPTGISRAS